MGLFCVLKIGKEVLIMLNQIIIGIMCVIAVAAGIWGWWIENVPQKEEKKDDVKHQQEE